MRGIGRGDRRRVPSATCRALLGELRSLPMRAEQNVGAILTLHGRHRFAHGCVHSLIRQIFCSELEAQTDYRVDGGGVNETVGETVRRF